MKKKYYIILGVLLFLVAGFLLLRNEAEEGDFVFVERGTLVKEVFETGSTERGEKGSHVKLKRHIEKTGEKQVMTIPDYKEVSKGTIKAIYNQALRYIPEENLREKFYKD